MNKQINNSKFQFLNPWEDQRSSVRTRKATWHRLPQSHGVLFSEMGGAHNLFLKKKKKKNKGHKKKNYEKKPTEV